MGLDLTIGLMKVKITLTEVLMEEQLFKERCNGHHEFDEDKTSTEVSR